MENRMLSVGSKFPQFSKTAVASLEIGNEFITVTNQDHITAGKWMVMFWWPMDFTFVCPTEISGFNEKIEEFTNKNALLVGASTDSQYVHLAWRKSHPDLKDLNFPMLADTSKSLAEELGILESKTKVAYRVTYIIDPEGIIRHLSVNDLSVGRNIDEVIRLLDAFQTGELTPCNWKKGEKTING